MRERHEPTIEDGEGVRVLKGREDGELRGSRGGGSGGGGGGRGFGWE